MVTQVLERMPRGVKGVVVAVWCQAVLNFLAGVLAWTLMHDRLTHNQDVADLGLVRFSVFTAFAASAALAVSGALAWKRFGWVRVTVLVVEGVPAAGLGLAVAALVGRTMLGAPAREWFNR
ncbi:hypothetical protein ACGFY7_07745 [Streptomyces prunicolor]|uniref:hypothetical protein n=1 Tax=Streptomyces prunicolor TaxID=67348 RepID=UPI00372255DA